MRRDSEQPINPATREPSTLSLDQPPLGVGQPAPKLLQVVALPLRAVVHALPRRSAALAPRVRVHGEAPGPAFRRQCGATGTRRRARQARPLERAKVRLGQMSCLRLAACSPEKA